MNFEGLNHPDRERRLAALRELAARRARGELPAPPRTGLVNNHIHTSFSFSPYSPAAAVWHGQQAGLDTAGIVDHDTVGGAEEFLEAGRIAGLPVTVGVECRVDMAGTLLAGRRINNPDQESNAYIVFHGIPGPGLAAVQAFFAPLREARNRRNRRMVERLNARLAALEAGGGSGLALDFEADVLPLSHAAEGGSVTERHILFALAGKMEARFDRGAALVEFLERRLGLRPGGRVRDHLLDAGNPFYRYDLLGALKSGLVAAFYVDAAEECPPVREAVTFARQVGAIPAYSYLGDVGESVTGDKRPQRFEDAYLPELFEVVRGLGFQAVTYMPSRNTPAQLARLRELCVRHGLFQISGEDINTPRQSFLCRELGRPEFRNLIDAAWALIGHEREAGRDPRAGMFSAETVRRFPDLDERIRHYARIGEKA